MVEESQFGCKKFIGTYTAAVSAMKTQKYTSINNSQIMVERLNALGKDDAYVDLWWRKILCTSDSLSYSKDGGLNLVLNPKLFTETNIAESGGYYRLTPAISGFLDDNDSETVNFNSKELRICVEIFINKPQ